MRYILYAILMASAVPLYAQEIRLDSLWIKMGGYPTMAFSPDSKTLLLGQADGIVNIVNVLSGIPLDSIILPKNGYADFGFSPDGKYLIVSERKKITFYSALTWDSVGEIRDIETVGFLSFSNDGAYVAVADWYSTISVVDLIHRKQIYLIKRPDEYKGSNNQNLPYFNGKVYFSEDGTRLYGKNANDFGFWDLTKKDTPFSRSFTIGNRAVIGFTPDRKYMIQQSNYIWDLNTKSQLQIQGLESYSTQIPPSFASTKSGTHIVVTQKDTHFPVFINPYQKKIVNTDINYYALAMAISPDSTYFAYQYGNGRTHVHNMSWSTTQINDHEYVRPRIDVTPLPSGDSIKIMLTLPTATNQVILEIHNIAGEKIAEIYRGTLTDGTHQYHFHSSNLPNGTYYIIAETPTQSYSVPFIITK